MQAFALGFLIRAAVGLPLFFLATAGLWLEVKKIGYLRLDQLSIARTCAPSGVECFFQYVSRKEVGLSP